MSAAFELVGHSCARDGGSTSVLLVEDNPADALLVREMLVDARGGAIDVRHASTLAEGLAEVSTQAPACVLLDLNLPDASAFGGLRRFLDAAGEIPVVVLTGQQEEGVGEMAVHLGAQDYLVKGRVDGELLGRSIRHAIERHESRRLLEASERRIRALFDHMPVGNCSIDVEGRIREANRALATCLQTVPRALVGRPFDDLLEAGRGTFSAWCRRFRPPGATSVTAAATLLAADGAPVTVRMTAAPVRDGSGDLAEVVVVVEDLTAEHHAQQELRGSEARFRALVHNLSEIVCVFDADGRIRYSTPSVAKVLGLIPSGSIADAGSILDVMHPDDRRRVAKGYGAWVRGEAGPAMVSCRVEHADGTWRTLELVGVNLLDDPAVRGIVVTARDVTEREEAERQREHEALHDPLTGLPNRQLFMNRLQHALQRAERTAQHVAVLFVDLDRFKMVNDAFGHGGGDEVLRAVAELLDSVVRPDDTVARFGGDEFIVLCEGLDAHGAHLIAERMTKVLERPFGGDGTKVHLSASVGIAVAAPAHLTNANDLVRDADTALTKAKAEGRARAVLFDGALRLRSLRRAQIEDALRGAAEAGQLELHFQPQVELATGAVRAFEALLRWTHPDLGAVSPAEFIPIAEETGLILAIGRWVLEGGCDQLATWRTEHPGHEVSVAVNVSAQQLAEPDFAAVVTETIAAAGVPANLLRLEITESAVMENPVASAQVLGTLKEAGVRLSIDDFGTGYSSLAYLKRFPIDELKIDRAFVAGLGTDAEDTVIVSSVVHLARSLGISVVAEGVETQQQLDQLVALGCDVGQGYFWARPEAAPVAGGRIAAGFDAATMAEPSDADHAGEGPLELDAIAVVAHELRSPLTVIRGFAEMMADLVHNGRTDLLDGALDAVNRQARHMELVIKDLAEASAVGSAPTRLAIERVDLGTAVAAVVGDLQGVLDQHHVEVVGAPVVADADPGRLRQILTNLLTNAAKFSPPGSTVTVELAHVAPMAVVRVIDRGSGVPPARVGELFGKFSRLGATAKGMGIGLYLSRALARAHGGELSYEPSPAGGAVFTLAVPAAPVAPSRDVEPHRHLRTRELGPSMADPEAAARTEVALDRLVEVQQPEQVVGVAIRLVRDLGGSIAPGSATGPDVLPIDISFGEGEPLVVVAPSASLARMRLEIVLPWFTEDARDVVQACRQSGTATRVDVVTGMLSRRDVLRPISASNRPWDVLVLGLDQPPADDELDPAMRWLSRVTRELTDEVDLTGRWDRHRLLVAGRCQDDLTAVAVGVRERWRRFGPIDSTLSAAIATTDGGASAGRTLARATAVLRRAARGGGGIVEVIDAR